MEHISIRMLSCVDPVTKTAPHAHTTFDSGNQAGCPLAFMRESIPNLEKLIKLKDFLCQVLEYKELHLRQVV